ncbi:autotransporter-associated beta strand repeat-containing protein [Candidatus Auribacterota bacterium]
MLKKLMYIFGAIILVAGSISSGLYAVNRSWDGGGDDNNWSTAENWDGVVSGGEGLAFGGSTRTTNNNDLPGGTSFGLIRFNNEIFTVGGNSVILTDGIWNLIGMNTFNCDISLNNVSQQFSNDVGLLTLGGAIDLGNATLTVEGDTTLLSGVISGTGGITRSGGSGITTLSATNTYSGATTISSGTLNVTGSISDSTVTISGGVLTGSGTVGDLNVNNGGSFSPGESTGTLVAQDTTWAAGGKYIWEINDAAGTKGDPTGWDWLNIPGGGDVLDVTATSESTFTIEVSSMGGDAANFDNSQNYTWIIASAAGGITGYSADKFTVDNSAFTNALGGGAFGISQSGNDINITFAAVPEPSTVGLFLIAIPFIGWFARKRKRAHT